MPLWLLSKPALYTAAGVAILALLWGVKTHYIHQGAAIGRAEVQKLWDSDIKAREAALEALQAEVAKKEADDAAKSKALQDALMARLRASDSNARSLADRLRDYQGRRCDRPLSEAPGAAPGADGAPGESGYGGDPQSAIDLALESHLGACGRDAVRLGGWQEWWQSVQ